MRPRTRALVVAVPLAELVTAMAVASAIGWGWTLALLLACAVVGAAVVAGAGREALGALASGGAAPPRGSGWRAAAGVLIAVPGFLTSLAGAALLVPGAQRAVTSWARRRAGSGGGIVVEGIVVRDGDGPAPRGELGPS